MRKSLALFALLMSSASVFAQTQPAQMGITPTTAPEVLQTLDNTKTWVPLGTVDSTTHKFSVVGGGSNVYLNHADLLAHVTATPSPPQPVSQQGFYNPGDGGAATYQWSASSYCPTGTSSAPFTADSVVCILPASQSASAAGRYLLQTSSGIDVRQIGMLGDATTDNSPLVATLMAAIGPTGFSGGANVLFPHRAGEYFTDYYFSQPFHVTRHINIQCQGLASGGSDPSTRLVFAAGVHGVVFDNQVTAPDGQYGGGGMSNCGVVGKSYHENFSTVIGSSVLTGVGAEHTYGAWDYQVGDGIIAYRFASWDASAPFGPPGATVVAANSTTHSITLSSSITPTRTAADGTSIWRLPVEKAYTINATSGSSTVTVTGGPDLLRPGDYIWSDAFPFGTVVMNESGTVGTQTITMGTWPLEGFQEQNAIATRSGGKMWLIPAGIKMHVQTSLHKNYLSSWGIGLEMECTSWTVPGPSGCNNSYAQENQFWFSTIGRLVIGDNAGASTSIGNGYAYNSMADVVEGGAVGSTYYNENTNSQESSWSLNGLIGLCVNSNSSSFFGGYNTTAGGYCLQNWGQLTTNGGTVMFIGNQESTPVGAPAIASGAFINKWYFNNHDTDGTQLCMNLSADIVLAWSSGNQSCGGPLTWELTYNNPGYWQLLYFGVVGGAPMWLTEGASGGYTGYQAGNNALVTFPHGFLLSSTVNGSTPGNERLIDQGAVVPTETYHLYGDVRFNKVAVPGSNLAWVNTYNGLTTIGANIVQGTTTSVPVGACPSPALPAGTPVGDNAVTPTKILGTLATCVGTTLTFQAAASANATSGDQILFLLWKAAGPVANDAAGTSWTLGNTMTLTPVALASLPATCTAGTFAVINDGVASPTYNAAVGSTTGAAADPVFCTNGNVWKYH